MLKRYGGLWHLVTRSENVLGIDKFIQQFKSIHETSRWASDTFKTWKDIHHRKQRDNQYNGLHISMFRILSSHSEYCRSIHHKIQSDSRYHGLHINVQGLHTTSTIQIKKLYHNLLLLTVNIRETAQKDKWTGRKKQRAVENKRKIQKQRRTDSAMEWLILQSGFLLFIKAKWFPLGLQRDPSLQLFFQPLQSAQRCLFLLACMLHLCLLLCNRIPK